MGTLTPWRVLQVLQPAETLIILGLWGVTKGVTERNKAVTDASASKVG